MQARWECIHGGRVGSDTRRSLGSWTTQGLYREKQYTRRDQRQTCLRFEKSTTEDRHTSPFTLAGALI